jgi:putative copper export protein
VLVALATVSGAAIVLSLTVIVIGLQMSSRFGSRASRMLGATPVGQWLAVAALLGVAAPIWAAAGPWSWLRAVAFASFAWAILALGLGGYATLEHLSPRWLSVHIVRRLQRASDRGEVPNWLKSRWARRKGTQIGTPLRGRSHTWGWPNSG